MFRPGHRVVVLGASIGGILAARVLADRVDHLTLVDRDDLPETPVNRGGAPHGRHAHGLLSRGLSVLEELFPGTTDDLVARGAVLGDAQRDGTYVLGGHRLADGTAGLPILAVSRPLLEWYLRRRLLREHRVTLLDRTSVLDLAFTADDRRVVGAVVVDRDGGVPRLEPAGLVVDATGRASRTPEWLERRGYVPPPEEVRRIDKRYVTRQFRRLGGPDEPVLRSVGATPAHPRGGIMLATEGGRWTMSLAGVHGERPPLDLDGFRAWAEGMAAPDLARALDGLVPLGDGATYRFPANLRRHYERLDRFPEGLVAIGDALCAFDPVFGQGMTVAALEAVELGRCLETGRADLATRFHAGAAAVIDTPWQIAAGAVSSQRARLDERLTGRYLARLVAAAQHDPALAAAFLRVSHLVDAPHDLHRPAVVARVLVAGRHGDAPDLPRHDTVDA